MRVCRVHGLATLMLALVFAGCASEQREPPAPPLHTLADCTDEVSDESQGIADAGLRPWSAAALSMDEREKLLQLASSWAADNCYIPCDFQMCAGLMEVDPGKVIAYIRPARTSRDAVYPEASVVFDQGSMAMVTAVRLHSGCAHWTGDCEPAGSM